MAVGGQAAAAMLANRTNDGFNPPIFYTPTSSDPYQWQVTPETARLLEHWRHHDFAGIRPFFCQVEAVETAIWLTEVAPQIGKVGQPFIDHLARANNDANPADTIPSDGGLVTWAGGNYARRRGVPTLLSIHTRLENPAAHYSRVFRGLDATMVKPMMRRHQPATVCRY